LFLDTPWQSIRLVPLIVCREEKRKQTYAAVKILDVFQVLPVTVSGGSGPGSHTI